MRAKVATLVVLVSSIAALALILNQPEKGKKLPVPRNETVIMGVGEGLDILEHPRWNRLAPKGLLEFTSRYLVFAREHDWYTNFATGKNIMWRIKGWEYKNNFKKMIVHVRDGVKWNDGVPYTAEDIAFSINYLKKYLPDRTVSQKVKSAKAIDNLTVEITFHKPFPRFHYRMRGWTDYWVIPKHQYEGKKPEEVANSPPIETGPYKLYDQWPKLDLIVWERDENWWARKVLGVFPKPKYILVRNTGPLDIRKTIFSKGEVDVVDLPPLTKKILKGKMGEKFAGPVFPDLAPKALIPNHKVYPLNLRKVRWAMSYAINRKRLSELISGFTAKPVKQWAAPYPAVKKYVYSDLQAKYNVTKYDPKKANEILDGLGFKKADDVRVTPNGTRLEFDMLVGAPPDPGYTAGSLIQEQFKRIGIKINLVTAIGREFGRREKRGKFDITVAGQALTGEVTSTGDIYYLVNRMASGCYYPIGEKMPNDCGNFGRYENFAEIDPIEEKLETLLTTDPEYKKLSRKVVEIYLRDLPMIPLVDRYYGNVFSNLHWTGWPIPF